MPRNVRNFWIDLNVDGRSNIATGPKCSGGGFTQTVYVRNNGEVHVAGTIRGEIHADDTITMVWHPRGGQPVVLSETKR